MVTMNRIFLFCFCFVIVTLHFGCQTMKVPDAKLWTDGAWALYKQIITDENGKTTQGTLKISSVGKEMVDGKPYYWLELRIDNKKGVVITKFLASEKKDYNPDDSFLFWNDIKQIIIQTDAKTPERIPENHLKRYAPDFIESSKSRRFGNVKDLQDPKINKLPEKSITVNGSSVVCTGKEFSRKYESSVNLGFLHLCDTSEIKTRYYHSSQVPFGGIVEVSHSSVTISENKLKPEEEPKPPVVFENALILENFGTSGAESQIIGDPVEKQVLPFPFLQQGNKNSKSKK